MEVRHRPFKHRSIVRFLLDFLFLLMDENLAESKFNLDVAASAIHSIKCYENNYTFKTTNKQQIIFHECEQLAYDTFLKKLIERSAETETGHLNYKYLSTQQLLCTIEKKNEQINLKNLQQLNFRREIVQLRNKQSDYKRLVKLLADNDVPGVCRLIKVCLDAKRGINGLIEF